MNELIKWRFNHSYSVMRTLVLMSMLLSLWGCASMEVNEDDPKSLYEAAENDIKSDRYLLALEKLRTVKNKFPYSQHSIMAKLRIADVHFMEESYPEAATAYEIFRELHPSHEKAPYAYFRNAESYFLDAPSTIARDLGSVQKALELFQGFANRYPNDPQAPEALKRIGEMKAMLSEKEMYVAQFYQRQEKHRATLARYKKIIELYPDTAAAKQARDRIPEVEKLVAAEIAKESGSP